MRGIRTPLFTGYIVWLGAACAGATAPGGSSGASGATARTVPADTPFTIAYGQEVTLAGSGLRLRFARLAEDSRCPTDVQCVWAGNARVGIRLQPGDTVAELNTGVDPRTVTHGGYVIELVELTPRPARGRTPSPSEYVATLRATRR